jgi:hypothetical protein
LDDFPAATDFEAGRAGVLPAVVLLTALLAVLFEVLLLSAARGFALTALGRADGLGLAVEAAARELFLADEAAAVLFFVALRTGAFSAPERLASGFGRAVVVFALNLRFFAGAALEALRVTGREEGLFALLLTDSLMRSSHYQNDSRIGAKKRAEFNTAHRINQRGSVSCGDSGAFERVGR